MLPQLFAALLLSMSMTAEPTPTPTVTSANGASSERAWSIERPSRGAMPGPLRAASEFPRSLRPWAACVLDRESGGTLDDRTSGMGARNPSPNSSAAGRWQFLDNQWRRGLSFMVRDRLIAHGMPRPMAGDIREHLSRLPINEWPGIYQDVGFLEVVERGGRHHWDGPGC